MKKSKAIQKKVEVVTKSTYPPAIVVVVIISIINIIIMTHASLELAGVFEKSTGYLQGSAIRTWRSEKETLQSILIALSFIILAASSAATLGLIFLKKWAWTATMFLIGLGLTINFIYAFQGNPNYLLMLSRAIQALLLDQEPVRLAFEKNEKNI